MFKLCKMTKPNSTITKFCTTVLGKVEGELQKGSKHNLVTSISMVIKKVF